MLESAIEKAALARAKKEGWWGIKIVPQFVSGLPDRMFIGHGKVVFIEFKRPGGSISKIQRVVHRRFAEHGIIVYTCYSVEEVMDVLI